MQSDEQLAAAARDGDRAAFGELVGRYRSRLLRFLLARSATPADAEDALQDTFVNAYRYLESYDPRWRFSTWIYRIGIRAASRYRNDTVGGEAGIADPAADPLLAAMRASTRENLWVTARKVLSEEAYAALWLRYVEDLPVREVGAALERSTTWAKVTLMRARDRLARSLDNSRDEGGETTRPGGVCEKAR